MQLIKMNKSIDKPSVMIHHHLYTNKLETPLYAEFGGEGTPLLTLGINNWVGVIEKKDDWYRVVTIHSEGWINVRDVEERSPFNLHVRWEPGKPIQYIAA